MAPKMYLLAKPAFDVDVFLTFLSSEALSWRRTQDATEPEEIVEAAGRICYMSFGPSQSPRNNGEYIQNLIQMGHESVLEHVSWTILMTGVSRAFTHQLVRHRIGFAFSQLSQQYHDEKDATFVMPPGLENVPGAVEVWEQAIKTAMQAYASIMNSLGDSPVSRDLSRKEALRAVRSAARSVLPNATETKIIVTANARAIRHLLKTRGAIPGDGEMRCVMTELFNTLQPEAPSLFFDFELQNLADGLPAVVHMPHQELSKVS
jgi:thymidylate synthase (FAD)